MGPLVFLVGFSENYFSTACCWYGEIEFLSVYWPCIQDLAKFTQSHSVISRFYYICRLPYFFTHKGWRFYLLHFDPYMFSCLFFLCCPGWKPLVQCWKEAVTTAILFFSWSLAESYFFTTTFQICCGSFLSFLFLFFSLLPFFHLSSFVGNIYNIHRV